MEELNLMVQNVSGFVWNLLLIFLLVGTGLFYTVKLKFIQVRKFGEGYTKVVKGVNLNGEAAGADGMSSFQSLATAVAAQVGTGNLAGAANSYCSRRSGSNILDVDKCIFRYGYCLCRSSSGAGI